MPNYLLSIYQPDGEAPPPEVLGPIMEQAGSARTQGGAQQEFLRRRRQEIMRGR